MDTAGDDSPLFVLLEMFRVVVQQVVLVRRQVASEEVSGTHVQDARLKVCGKILKEVGRTTTRVGDNSDSGCAETKTWLMSC